MQKTNWKWNLVVIVLPADSNHKWKSSEFTNQIIRNMSIETSTDIEFDSNFFDISGESINFVTEEKGILKIPLKSGGGIQTPEDFRSEVTSNLEFEFWEKGSAECTIVLQIYTEEEKLIEK